MSAVEPIDGSTATPAELRRAGIEALVKALGPIGMARFSSSSTSAMETIRPSATAFSGIRQSTNWWTNWSIAGPTSWEMTPRFFRISAR